MPLDVLGRTRATLMHSTSLTLTERSGKPSNLHRDGDRLLQLLIFNEEYLVSACHQRALITSLPFVHTARRSYRLNDPVRPPDCGDAAGSPAAMPREAVQTLSFRGRRSRNKVSVGEPAEGSFARIHLIHCEQQWVRIWVGMEIASMPPCGYSRAASQARTVFWACPCCQCLFDILYLPIHSEWSSTLYLLTTFSDGCLGSNNDEGRSEV